MQTCSDLTVGQQTSAVKRSGSFFHQVSVHCSDGTIDQDVGY